MSSVNPFGIFANTIGSGVNTGIGAVRDFNKTKCAAVYRACVAVLPADEVAFVLETFPTAYNGGQSDLDQVMALTGCTAAQAWCSRMLQSVDSHFTKYIPIVGSENTDVITDSRAAAPVLRRLLAA